MDSVSTLRQLKSQQRRNRMATMALNQGRPAPGSG